MYVRIPKNKSKKRGKKNNKALLRPMSPPEIAGLLRVGVTLRYVKTSTSIALVYTNCFSKLLCMALTATTAGVIYESILIKKISAWGIGVTNNSAGGFDQTTNAVALRCDDGAVAPYGQERRFTDIPTTTRGAFVSAKMKGLNASWLDAKAAQSITGQRFFVVEGPMGTVVDLKVVIQLIVNGSSGFATFASAGLNSKVLYFNYLDNTDTTAAAAGTQFLKNINGPNFASMV